MSLRGEAPTLEIVENTIPSFAEYFDSLTSLTTFSDIEELRTALGLNSHEFSIDSLSQDQEGIAVDIVYLDPDTQELKEIPGQIIAILNDKSELSSNIIGIARTLAIEGENQLVPVLINTFSPGAVVLLSSDNLADK